MTTRELALLCSYARSALLTSGKFCARESVFHSSPSLCAPAPSAAVADESRRRSSASSSRKSSSISDGDGSEGEDVADVTESAGVVWNAAGTGSEGTDPADVSMGTLEIGALG